MPSTPKTPFNFIFGFGSGWTPRKKISAVRRSQEKWVAPLFSFVFGFCVFGV